MARQHRKEDALPHEITLSLDTDNDDDVGLCHKLELCAARHVTLEHTNVHKGKEHREHERRNIKPNSPGKFA